MIPTTLQRYVLREIIRVAFLSVIALTAMIFIGLSISLVRNGLSVVQLSRVIPYVLIHSLPYALPSAFLLAAVFVFGRLSGQNEISAIRSSGVNLNHVIAPPLILALLVCAGTFVINQYIQPWSLHRMRAMADRLIGEVVRQVGNSDHEYRVGNYVIYVGGVDEKRNLWKNVGAIQFAGEVPSKVVIAEFGTCEVDEARGIASLTLLNGTIVEPLLGAEDKGRPGTMKFTRTTYHISLTGEDTFLSNRPRYLLLRPLWEDIRKLRVEVRELRKSPAYAPIQRAHTVRKLIQKEFEKAYGNYSKMNNNLAARIKDVEKARMTAEQAEGNSLAARAAYDAVVQRRQETEKSLADTRAYLEQLKSEAKSPTDENVSLEQIEEQQKELDRVGERLKQLTASMQETAKEVNRHAQSLAAADAQFQDKKKELARLEALMAAEQVEVFRVRTSVGKQERHLANLRKMERLLEAEAEFHFRSAGALTTLVFMLIGIPLGIYSRHGNLLMAFVISFGLVLIVYYPLIMIGEMLATDGYLIPWVAQWSPNMIVGAAGLVLLTWGVRR